MGSPWVSCAALMPALSCLWDSPAPPPLGANCKPYLRKCLFECEGFGGQKLLSPRSDSL